MGVDFIAKKENKFTHRRDKKFTENIQAANLLSGASEKTTRQFRCKAEGDMAPEVGLGVSLFEEEGKIKVLYLGKPIGVMMSPDAAALKKIWEESGIELSSAGIVEVRPAAKIFVIQLL